MISCSVYYDDIELKVSNFKSETFIDNTPSFYGGNFSNFRQRPENKCNFTITDYQTIKFIETTFSRMYNNNRKIDYAKTTSVIITGEDRMYKTIVFKNSFFSNMDIEMQHDGNLIMTTELIYDSYDIVLQDKMPREHIIRENLKHLNI